MPTEGQTFLVWSLWLYLTQWFFLHPITGRAWQTWTCWCPWSPWPSWKHWSAWYDWTPGRGWPWGRYYKAKCKNCYDLSIMTWESFKISQAEDYKYDLLVYSVEWMHKNSSFEDYFIDSQQSDTCYQDITETFMETLIFFAIFRVTLVTMDPLVVPVLLDSR